MTEPSDWQRALEVTATTLKVGLVASVVTLAPGVALGYAFSRRRSRWMLIARTLVALPMVLPPVAVGLLLLAVLARSSPVGGMIETIFGAPMLLTWPAAALAAAVMSFPLVVLGAQQGFDGVGVRVEQVAASLGATRWQVLRRVTLPLAARGILYGVVFGFARGLGEFGATALVAGSIPGETETLSLAIYDRIHAFRDREAWTLAGVSAAISCVAIGAAETFLRRRA
jgi:molybdate transport system permease protein